MSSPRIRPDVSAGLDVRVARRLNDRFYTRAPHLFFELRLLGLLSVHRGRDEPDSLPETDLVDQVIGQPMSVDPSAIEPAFIDVYVAADAQVLLHHVNEALLRFYLAHRTRPICPWMEIAALTSFTRFEKELVALVALPTESLVDSLGLMMFDGRADAEQQSGLAVGAEVLQDAATRVLDDAHLYNAAKHGFAVLPNQSAIEFAVAGDGPDDLISAFNDHGHTLETLEQVEVDGARRWRRVLRFVDHPTDLARVWLAIRLLGNLWNVARVRYSGGGEVRIHHLTADLTPQALSARSNARGTVFTIDIGARPLSGAEATAVASGITRASPTTSESNND